MLRTSSNVLKLKCKSRLKTPTSVDTDFAELTFSICDVTSSRNPFQRYLRYLALFGTKSLCLSICARKFKQLHYTFSFAVMLSWTTKTLSSTRRASGRIRPAQAVARVAFSRPRATPGLTEKLQLCPPGTKWFFLWPRPTLQLTTTTVRPGKTHISPPTTGHSAAADQARPLTGMVTIIAHMGVSGRKFMAGQALNSWTVGQAFFQRFWGSLEQPKAAPMLSFERKYEFCPFLSFSQIFIK